MMIKLVTRGDADVRWFRWQVLLLGLGSVLYIGPYLLGSQMTLLHGARSDTLMPLLVTSKNPDLALPLCYLSALAVGIVGIAAVVFNLRGTAPRTTTARAVAPATSPAAKAQEVAR